MHFFDDACVLIDRKTGLCRVIDSTFWKASAAYPQRRIRPYCSLPSGSGQSSFSCSRHRLAVRASDLCITRRLFLMYEIVMTIRAFLAHRKELGMLSSAPSTLTSSRYMRLMLFASLDVCFLFPLNLLFLYLTSEQAFYEWKGLADLHFGFSFVGQVPASVWRASQSSINQVMITPTSSIAACFVFFAFFGLAKESRDHYRAAYYSLKKLFSSTNGSRDVDE